jgi:hypothetical protein
MDKVDITLANHIKTIEDELEASEFTMEEGVEYYERLFSIANKRRNEILREMAILAEKENK